MGGCRCTFRDCENNSSNSKGMHFFHFPVRDMDRCKIWTQMAKKPEFLELPQERLRNKVVCEAHFKLPMFMNRLKERLIRTAIPTLYLKDKRERMFWDMEANSYYVEDPESIGKSVEEEMEYMAQNIEFEEASQEEEEEVQESVLCPPTTEIIRINSQELSEPPMKVIKLNVDPNEGVKILNKSFRKGLDSCSSTRVVKVLNARQSPKVNVLNTAPIVLQKVVMKKKQQSLIKKEPVPEVKETVVDDEVYSDANVIENESIVNLPIVAYSALVNQETQIKPTIDESIYAQKLEEQSKQIEELKQLILESINQKPAPLPAPPVVNCESSPKMEKSQMNKVQLFNGIKRYLNPSMVAMLRMEMFGGNDRQYKSDEKTVCTELLSLGIDIYKFFADEYRFRLPPIKEVEKWAQDKPEDDLENL